MGMTDPGSDAIPGLFRQALRGQASAWGLVLLFSAAFNLLLLTGPIYMLQVYDRVLRTGSQETLVALSLLAALILLATGLIDHMRGRIVARIGARVQDGLDGVAFRASLGGDRRRPGPMDAPGFTATRDVAAVRAALAAPVSLAVLDAPWAPAFAALIFVLHPVLGLVAMAGALGLIGVAVLSQAGARGRHLRAQDATLREQAVMRDCLEEAETLRALGMAAHAERRWADIRRTELQESMAAADLLGAAGAFNRTARLMLQAAMIGVGALLVLGGDLTAGAVLAASILMARALAPLDHVLAAWGQLAEAARASRRLARTLQCAAPAKSRTALPAPAARLSVRNLSVVPAGQARPTLRDVSFDIGPGEALGIIGPSGSGKSTLIRALAGLVAPAAGCIRLSDAPLAQYTEAVLGRSLGYLPQNMRLFDGSVAENIARLAPDADAGSVIRAAREAGAHEMILRLPDGYDTRITGTTAQLSGGQVQRIGLARALFGDPVLLLLDEPNAALDSEGSDALDRAIARAKSAGRSVIVAAHRPGAIRHCDRLLVLKEGRAVACGPTADILERAVGLRKRGGARPPAGSGRRTSVAS